MFLDNAHSPQFLKDASVVARLHLFPVGDFVDMLRRYGITPREGLIHRGIAGELAASVY